MRSGKNEIIGGGIDGAVDHDGRGARDDEDGRMIIKVVVEDVGGESGEFGERLGESVGAGEVERGAKVLGGEVSEGGGGEFGLVIFAGVAGGGVGKDVAEVDG